MSKMTLTAAMTLALVAPGPLAARVSRQPDGWGYMNRLEQAAMLNDFNARLLSSNSATRTLEEWCLAHRIAPVVKIVAERIKGQDKPVTAEQRARLDIAADEPVRYRRVLLKCGAAVLSEADNWYVPSRLTAAMNAALDGEDAPFGRVVAPLDVNRKTLSAKVLWNPMENDDWDMRSSAANVAAYARRPSLPPDFVIEHRALVFDRNMKPISEVFETYTKAILNSAPSKR
ncbi:hypothetical protein [Sphingobium boeckii]|uniref:Chorismate-pyruvate lyase n=1 Tax=Sphingobium boeckii TaxID=1082345 RepID=A0A7W9AJ54_9SPHN|nr:hypothetical protein [Sphingobium boeckii]MBB5686431.1 chorismate-pyruvate lyase [Sphingobium boeckii]